MTHQAPMTRLALLVGCGLMLAACSGETDSAEPPVPASPPAVSEELPPPSPASEEQFPVINDVRVLHHELLEATVNAAASAGPHFHENGVEQVSNRDYQTSENNHVLVDLDTSRSGVKLEIMLAEGGPNILLDSAEHSVTEPLDSSEEPDRGPLLDYGFSEDHERRAWTMLRTSATEAATGYVEANWDDKDPTNPISSGYWIHLDGDYSADQVNDIDVGTFIHGPEFSGNPTFPPSGKVTYSGRVTGIYTFFYGPAWANLGLTEIEETGIFHGLAQLTVDYSTNQIEGCIGCLAETEDDSYRLLDFGGITLHPLGIKSELYALYHNINTEVPEGFQLTSYTNLDSFLDEVNVRESQYRIFLDQTSINSDGTLQDENVKLQLDYFLERAKTDGTWGATFSSINDAAGNPRRIIGTLGGSWDHPGGGLGSFIGNFYVSTNPVKQ